MHSEASATLHLRRVQRLRMPGWRKPPNATIVDRTCTGSGTDRSIAGG
jgi:hypothetical protein